MGRRVLFLGMVNDESQTPKKARSVDESELEQIGPPLSPHTNSSLARSKTFTDKGLGANKLVLKGGFPFAIAY
jgi:hypothetical protein